MKLKLVAVILAGGALLPSLAHAERICAKTAAGNTVCGEEVQSRQLMEVTLQPGKVTLVAQIDAGGGGLVEKVGKTAEVLAGKINAASKSRVAVLDFTSLAGDQITELGRLLVELLNVYLASSSYPIEVVDRVHLENVLKEQKLSKSGLFNPQTSAKIGELSGVDTVIIGTHSEVGGKYLISFKIINTETAANIGSELLILDSTDEIRSLYRSVISAETDSYATSDKIYVNSASFYTDNDTIRCRGLGTFKSYPHALAYACSVQPVGKSTRWECAWLDGTKYSFISLKEEYTPAGNCDKFPKEAMRRLLREVGR